MVTFAGYDDDFLGAIVPLPVPLSPAHATRLDYPHFSVLLMHERRLAGSTAVNIDGAALVEAPRSGEWHLDPRVPAAVQAGAEVYRRNDLDRGHLVRRRDPGWGTDAVAATEATFAYPNAAPQVANFNQSPQLWLGLEDHVLTYADAYDHRVSVFTAPVLGADDPPYRGIRIPRRFWKIAAWVDTPGALRSAAFLLDQSDLLDGSSLLTADRARVPIAPLPPFRTFQVPAADVSALTGLDLGPLVNADVLSAPAARRPRWVALDTPDDITLV